MVSYIKRIRSIYLSLSKVAKASIWFIFCNIVQKGIAFLTTPVFTRIMSTEEYGQYTLYNSWYSLLLVFATFNLFYGVYNNGMTKFSEDRERFTASLQVLCTLITFCVLLIYLLNIEFWNCLLSTNTTFVCLMFVQFFSYPAWEFWIAEQRYDYKYHLLVLITILTNGISVGLSIVAVLYASNKSLARIFPMVGLNLIVGSILYIRNLIKGKWKISKFYWKYALKFNIPLIPHYLSSSLLNHADRIMIGNMIGSSEAAIYGVAYSIAMTMNIVSSAITNAFTPYMYQSIKSGEVLKLRKKTNILIIIVACMCILTMLFAPELIRIVAAEEYYNAVWIIPAVSASVFFCFLYPLFSNVEFYFEKTKFIMLASCMSALINIILNYVFIPLFGYLAAGYTTLIGYIAYAFVHYLFHKYLLKKNRMTMIYNEKILFIISGIICIFSVVSIALYYCTIFRYMLIISILLCGIIKGKKIYLALKT